VSSATESTEPPHVVVVGSVNHDVVNETARIPAAGETVLALRSRRNVGGKGSNQAVAAARAGARVSLAAPVGELDPHADRLRRTLADYRVDVRGVRTVPGRFTGAAYITVARGENQIVVDPGANLMWDDLDADLPTVATAAVTVAQLETPTVVAQRLSEVAERLVLNAAPASPLPDDLLARCDPLVVNEHELAVVAGRSPGRTASVSAVLDHQRLLRARGVPSVVTTLGEQGAVWSDGTGSAHQPTIAVSVVDTTGAGDVFTGYLAARLASGDRLVAAVRHATAAGTLAVTRAGTHAASPTPIEVGDALTRLPEARMATEAERSAL
jgi:ribokinase